MPEHNHEVHFGMIRRVYAVLFLSAPLLPSGTTRTFPAHVEREEYVCSELRALMVSVRKILAMPRGDPWP